jgi:predicted GH43/DUF377 family glycosyl hydrolase
MKITAGEFKKIYDPSVGMPEKWYINDHCFVQDDDGTWHMFGITHQEPAAPKDEKFFAHATSRELLNPQWEKHEHVLHANFDRWQETHVWAPHVIKHDDHYYMYYCGGGTDDANYKIHLATSPDLWDWTRHESNPMVIDGYHARDPMVLRHEDQWIMYYTANSEPAGGNHVVAAVTSQDLVHWKNKRVVFVHPKRGTYGGPTESPFVVRRNGSFYLFVCTNEPYNDSAVYESDNPWNWSFEGQVGQAPSHASEVIQTPSGEWFLSRAGWGEGGLYLAPLEWLE